MSMFLLLTALATSALAGRPAAVEPTADELAKLQRGDVIVRSPATSTSEVLGFVDTKATREQAWKVILDFDARVEAVSVLKKIESYDPPEGYDLGVTFHLSVLGTSVVYHLLYELDPDGYWCSYHLDPAREHGIEDARGSYLITPIDGGHRITYRAATDTGRFVPGFVQKMLAQGQLKSQLASMQTRAPTL